jgi:AcrR family transcriptional regulator
MLQTPTVSVVIATVKADMGYRHTREEILEGALAVALDVGLSRLTFGRVATAMGINDRTVVYYFPTKDDLITEVVMSMGVQLQATLGQAFSSPAAGHLELARAAWPVLARPDADAIFALFFEANGLAAAGRPPFDSLVPQLVEAWVTWVMSHLTGTKRQRRAEAEATIALLDGLLLLRQLGGPDSAARAARRLGVAGR